MNYLQVAVKLESVKARHPQLLYESKLYKILQVRFFQNLQPLSELTTDLTNFLSGRSRNTTHTLVRAGARLQCARHGPSRAKPGGPLQLLLQAVHHEDRPHAGRPDDREDRVCPQQELHPPGHQARQLPDGDRATLQQALLDRLWSGQEVPGQQDTATHPIQRGQEPHRHCQVSIIQLSMDMMTVKMT